MIKALSFKILFFYLGAFLFSCGNPFSSSEDEGNELPSYVVDYLNEISKEVADIKEGVFALSDVDEEVWQLALVGNFESISEDLCDEEDECSNFSSGFQKLVGGNVYFDLLQDEVKVKISKVYSYFAGDDVVVFDSEGIAYSLNDLQPALGRHELTLVKREFIPDLNAKGYGLLEWKSPDESLVLKAYLDAIPAGQTELDAIPAGQTQDASEETIKTSKFSGDPAPSLLEYNEDVCNKLHQSDSAGTLGSWPDDCKSCADSYSQGNNDCKEDWGYGIDSGTLRTAALANFTDDTSLDGNSLKQRWNQWQCYIYYEAFDLPYWNYSWLQTCSSCALVLGDYKSIEQAYKAHTSCS